MAITPRYAASEDNTLFHHTPDAAHDAVLHTASLIAILLLAATILALLASWQQQRRAPALSGTPLRPETPDGELPRGRSARAAPAHPPRIGCSHRSA